MSLSNHRYGKRFVNFVVGNRSNKTAEEFWEKIEQHDMGSIASDYWKPYEHVIPKEKHIQSKVETFTVEGYNSLFWHFLDRMRRKSKCYSQKMEMPAISVLLLMHQRNGSLYIYMLSNAKNITLRLRHQYCLFLTPHPPGLSRNHCPAFDIHLGS